MEGWVGTRARLDVLEGEKKTLSLTRIQTLNHLTALLQLLYMFHTQTNNTNNNNNLNWLACNRKKKRTKGLTL